MSVLKRGALLGAVAGAGLSLAYTVVIIPVFGALLVATNVPNGSPSEALIGAILLPMCAWPFAVVLGILPGTMLGTIGGLLIGLIVLPVKAGMTQRKAALVGLLVGAGIVGGAHALLYPGLVGETRAEGISPLEFYWPYLFWLGLPSVLVLIGLTWVGWKILATDPEKGLLQRLLSKWGRPH